MWEFCSDAEGVSWQVVEGPKKTLVKRALDYLRRLRCPAGSLLSPNALLIWLGVTYMRTGQQPRKHSFISSLDFAQPALWRASAEFIAYKTRTVVRSAVVVAACCSQWTSAGTRRDDSLHNLPLPVRLSPHPHHTMTDHFTKSNGP